MLAGHVMHVEPRLADDLSASSNCAFCERWVMSPVWIMKAGFCGCALTWRWPPASVPSAFGLAGLSKPIWLSLICTKVSPGLCRLRLAQMPSEWGTPPETVHRTPVPAQVMHSSTLRRLRPSSRVDWLIFGLLIPPARSRMSRGGCFPASEGGDWRARRFIPARTAKIMGGESGALLYP